MGKRSQIIYKVIFLGQMVRSTSIEKIPDLYGCFPCEGAGNPPPASNRVNVSPKVLMLVSQF